MLSPGQLQVLAEAAGELGDGNIELTSRGNVQLRRIRDADALADRLDGAGLLPSRTHERVRNIIASPLSGRVGSHPDIRPLVAELDAGLLAAPRLAELPGRVLFTLDDGRGDVSALRPDIGLYALDDDRFALLLAGGDSGIRVSLAEAVEVLLAAADGFLGLGGGQWRLHEVDDGVVRLSAHLGLTPGPGRVELPEAPDPPIGWLPQNDGLVALGAGVRLGSLPARTAEFLAAVERPLLLTPWRGLIVTDLAEGPPNKWSGCWRRWASSSTPPRRGCGSPPAPVCRDVRNPIPTSAPTPPPRSNRGAPRRRARRPGPRSPVWRSPLPAASTGRVAIDAADGPPVRSPTSSLQRTGTG